MMRAMYKRVVLTYMTSQQTVNIRFKTSSIYEKLENTELKTLGSTARPHTLEFLFWAVFQT